MDSPGAGPNPTLVHQNPQDAKTGTRTCCIVKYDFVVFDHQGSSFSTLSKPLDVDSGPCWCLALYHIIWAMDIALAIWWPCWWSIVICGLWIGLRFDFASSDEGTITGTAMLSPCSVVNGVENRAGSFHATDFQETGRIPRNRGWITNDALQKLTHKVPSVAAVLGGGGGISFQRIPRNIDRTLYSILWDSFEVSTDVLWRC